MREGDFLRDLALAMVTVLPVALAIPVFLFLKRNWHPDAVRFQGRVIHAQRTLKRVILIVLAIAVVGRLAWPEQILDLVSVVLFLELGGWEVLAMGCALGFMGWTLRPGLAGGMAMAAWMGVAGLLAIAGIPSRMGYTWLLTLVTWTLAWRFLRIRILQDPPPQEPNTWIRRWRDRGAQTVEVDQVQERHHLQRCLQPDGSVYFGFTYVPADQAEGHFLIAGATGSGKTVLFRLLIQSVLPHLGKRVRGRAVIFDAKREWISALGGMGVSVPVTILNPFDARCRVWDLSADFHTPSNALQLARLLLPDEDGAKEDPFWRKTARGILADLIRAHILAFREGAIEDWSLADIISALASKETLERRLMLHPSTTNSLRNLGEERILFGVLAQVDLVRREFEVLAALWQDAQGDPERSFSLTEWVESDGVLVLGTATSDEEVLKPLNRLVLDRVGQLLLDLPERPHAGQFNEQGRTWLFLDEYPRLGRVTRMPTLMTNGRSKGLVAVIGIQDIADLQEHYGRNLSEIIAGSCSHQMQLEAPTASHAEWAEKQISGSQDVTTLSRTFSVQSGTQQGGGGRQTSWGASEKTRPLFSRDEIRNLGKPGNPLPVWEIPGWLAACSDVPILRDFHRFSTVATFSPIRAICRVQGQIYQAEIPFHDAIDALTPKEGEDYAARPVEDQFLNPHMEEETDHPPEEPTSKPPIKPTKAALLDALRSILPSRQQKP